MAFSLSELLNPVPLAGAASSNVNTTDMDATDPSANFFAPELFQQDDDATMAENTLLPVSQDVEMTMVDDTMMDTGIPNGDSVVDPGLVKEEMVDSGYPPLEDETLPAGDISVMDMGEGSLLGDNSSLRGSPEQSAKKPKHSGKSRKSVDANAASKSTIHSSKNEGQHTDRRYLCYLCNKLFTRRRSVRDHISKIHNTKTWEPVRSLEVIVEPLSGEPIEPLEEIIARGPPPPPPKQSKAQRAEKAAKHDEDEENEDEPQEEHQVEEEDRTEDLETKPVSEPRAAQVSTPQPSHPVATLKKEPSIAGSRASSTEPFATPAPVAGKKRPAPDDSAKSSAAAKKKGTAKFKGSTAPNKRSKLSSESEQSPPARSAYRSPSATPASTHLKPIPSKLKKQTSAASVKSSPTPASSRAASIEARSRSSSVADTPTSSNDDGEVFCICRKGDNHTWMIACDGGCEEWFHGNCVNIRERDGDLIDKYICPTCNKPGLQTTWKRMCRRKDCRKPARVMQDPPSKYCSDACGRMFFVELVQRGDPDVQITKDGQYIVEAEKPKKLRKKHNKKSLEGGRSKAPPKPLNNNVNGDVGTPNINDESRLATPAYSEEEQKTDYETDSSLDDDMLPNRGSALRAGEVKALLEKCKDIEEWRGLGRKPDTPPRDSPRDVVGEMSMSNNADDGGDTEPKPNPVSVAVPLELIFDELETAKMASIEEEKRSLHEHNDILSARELVLDLIKTRSTSITDEVKKAHPKMKDICGFDPRMAWSDEQFHHWYTKRGGKELLQDGMKAKIGPPEDGDAGTLVTGVNGVGDHGHEAEGDGRDGGAGAGDADGEGGGDGDGDGDAEEESMPKKGGVCIKNRCPRHRNWAKGQLAELRFEQDLVRRQLARCEAQQRKIRERATVRAWERRGASTTSNGGGGVSTALLPTT
ncbi:COMPASS (complex proteins associated with Set1p) component [Exophiala xenobiotica]|nr:COMPASS (complex proteins associated with Set1p) component [Exophiala xenobiotica]